MRKLRRKTQFYAGGARRNILSVKVLRYSPGQLCVSEPLLIKAETQFRERLRLTWGSEQVRAGLQGGATKDRENKREMGERDLWDSMNSAPFGLPHNSSPCEYTRFTTISNFWQDISMWSTEAPHKCSSTLESYWYFPHRGQRRWGLGANNLKTFANQNNCRKYYIFFLTVLN